ncbi:hypothetical protein GCM10011346_31910 [Oceanobacillus neutriphilus]|uniref:Uncharacterized protein n=1 Tax=Oceanobacillus neutriphilus TaxID=531815 RepID=A0ABQ2NXP5_9BACI|nr:hypothetical protein GCM10011346_31910 [Oceanobacillus neutriphilus]
MENVSFFISASIPFPLNSFIISPHVTSGASLKINLWNATEVNINGYPALVVSFLLTVKIKVYPNERDA